MKIHAKLWLETDTGKLLVGEGRLNIFRAVERTGSLSAAARELNMSYRAVWGKVRTTEERLGVKLIETVAGGHKRGGTHLTKEGINFINQFEEFDQQARRAIDELANELLKGIVSET
jgi:molybdate transport system regulatory protein